MCYSAASCAHTSQTQAQHSRSKTYVRFVDIQFATLHHSKLASKLIQFVIVNCAGGRVMCNTDRNDQREKYTAHCHVSHSINTVPTFSCPLQSASATKGSVHSEVKQLHVSQCAYDSTVYNETTFTINITDTDIPTTCTVRYQAVQNTSLRHAEEQFVVSHDMTPSTLDSARKSTEDNHRGKCEMFIALI